MLLPSRTYKLFDSNKKGHQKRLTVAITVYTAAMDI